MRTQLDFSFELHRTVVWAHESVFWQQSRHKLIARVARKVQPVRTQLLVNFVLHWQTMAVPAKAALDVVPCLRCIPGHHILQSTNVLTRCAGGVHRGFMICNTCCMHCPTYNPVASASCSSTVPAKTGWLASVWAAKRRACICSCRMQLLCPVCRQAVSAPSECLPGCGRSAAGPSQRADRRRTRIPSCPRCAPAAA